MTGDLWFISDADGRALVRLQADHVNRHLVPAFYRYLQAQDSGEQFSSSQSKLANTQHIVIGIMYRETNRRWQRVPLLYRGPRTTIRTRRERIRQSNWVVADR